MFNRFVPGLAWKAIDFPMKPVCHKRTRHDNVAPIFLPTMNRAICPSSVASWLFCILVAGLAPSGFGQQVLPPLIPVSVLNITIPFEVEEQTPAIREVELFVSQDRGKRWQLVTRQPVEAGKFTFRADTDGEYWFACRTLSLTGTLSSMTGHPELRVLVDTKSPVIAPSSRPSESGPVVPPKPERFRPEHMPKPQSPQPQLTSTEAAKLEPEAPPSSPQKINPETNPEKTNAVRPGQILAPRFPGFDLHEPEANHEGNLLDDLLSGMSSFMDVQPVAVRSIPDSLVAANKTNTASNTSPQPRNSANIPAGSIAGIVLKLPKDEENADTRSQIVVRWNTGPELWSDAQIDVLRSNVEGQWFPIAINLPNSGEYWWYLSPEDFKPFYVKVQIRSLHGGVSMDVTQSKIEIDPRLAVFQSQRP